MNVETQEINGFQIDTFNQYKLEEGKTQGTCPLCSADRKGEHKKAKCASYDWERGIGTCHNCNKTFQMHTYQRKGSSEKTYVKPENVRITEPDYAYAIADKVVEWFGTRGISRQTLEELMITDGTTFMPQTNKIENVIEFNYFMGDEVVNIKYRDGRKNFKLYKGAEKSFL